LTKKRTLIILLVSFVIIFVVLRLFIDKTSVKNQMQLKKQVQLLELQVDSLQNELDVQMEINQKLKEDTFYLESLIRTQYGMSKKGETPIQFIGF